MPPASRTPGPVRLIRGDARELPGIGAASVHLVVTSPPYPMIPLWDDLFDRLGANDYPAMHVILSDVWRACHRVLVPGGILAVNIGDAVRSENSEFQLWPNHATVLEDCRRIGFTALPHLLWQKPTNRPNAFLGSGFLPPNAYVTLDCEFILLFRKGSLRQFPPHDSAREHSRYSKEERDRWFTQVWTDVRGARQGPADRRTGAFPTEVPARLIRMFSVVGDTVLDPFAGTGTTVWTASDQGRTAIGVELDEAVFGELERRGAGRQATPVDAPSPRPRPA